ncbi:hypothetical protein [Streptomyces sp. 5-10]|uniref:hypothetical protein n=1 Tax=Streptomyces sp. 5-10 TaxID=878925 RepID=UPI00168B4EFD|nr:hypothetical protein [Streptomyces sp. 5-10]MBD3004808.1 hypothetical protein [Streptomyces sp. 5-10]
MTESANDSPHTHCCRRPADPVRKAGETANEAPGVRFARIATLDRRHAFYCAVRPGDWDRFISAYARTSDLTVEPFEFGSAAILDATAGWIADKSRESDRPPMVMIGSTENGRWVNWNLPVRPPTVS